MSKSSSGGLFGRRDTNQIAIVDAPVSQSYIRKARVTFYVVGVSVAILAGVVLSHYWHPILGAFGGTLIGVLAGLVVGSIVLVWPVLRAIWHWSAEISATLLLLYGWTALMQATTTTVSLLIIAAVVGVPAAIGPVRRRIVALVWCQISRHRLRLAFAQIIRTGNRNKPGQLPFILFARPTPAGERVWVWLRPGLNLTVLEAELPNLAVVCWADQVRVVRANRSQAALVRIDIARRDPLRTTVASPLVGLLPDGFDPSIIPTSPGLPPVGLDLPDVPEPAPPATGRPPRKPRPGDTPNP